MLGKADIQGNAGAEPAEQVESFRAGLHEHLSSWAEGGLEKCYSPAFYLLEKAPSDPHLSSIFPTVSKSFKLLPLYLVSLVLT